MSSEFYEYYLCGVVEQAGLPLELWHVRPWLSPDCTSLKPGHPTSFIDGKKNPETSASQHKTQTKSGTTLGCHPSGSWFFAVAYPDLRDAQSGAEPKAERGEPAPHLYDIPRL